MPSTSGSGFPALAYCCWCWVTPLWGQSYALQEVDQHPWALPTQCKWHHHPTGDKPKCLQTFPDVIGGAKIALSENY